MLDVQKLEFHQRKKHSFSLSLTQVTFASYMKCELALISGFPFQILSHSCRVILDMQEKFVLTYPLETLVADHQGDGTLV